MCDTNSSMRPPGCAENPKFYAHININNVSLKARKYNKKVQLKKKINARDR